MLRIAKFLAVCILAALAVSAIAQTSVATNPTTSQTITQPPGTSLVISSPAISGTITMPGNLPALGVPSVMSMQGDRTGMIEQGQTALMPDGNTYDTGGIIYTDVLRDDIPDIPAAYMKIRNINTDASFPISIRGTQLEFGTANGGAGQQVKASTALTIDPNGNVGIGTTTPHSNLEVNGILQADQGLKFPDGSVQTTAVIANPSISTVNGNTVFNGIMQVTGATNPITTNQGGYLGWNSLTGGTGETDLINNQGLGAGGFAFFNTPYSGTSRSLLMFLSGSGSLGLGLSNPGADLPANMQSSPVLEVNGNFAMKQGSGASFIFPDGTVQATAWNGTTLGGDYAEAIDVLGERSSYEPGDVIVIDADVDGKFKRSATAYSRMVAGVYSTKPGLVGRRTTVARTNKPAEVPMAMMGIVPTKVSTENGPIRRGDLLVTSDTPGYAMKATDPNRMTGAIVGKALNPLDSQKGVIEVLVSLQ